MWRQRARLDWLHDGDNNTKFFHSVASGHKKANCLDRLRENMGRWVEEADQICEVVTNYFTDVFTNSNLPY